MASLKECSGLYRHGQLWAFGDGGGGGPHRARPEIVKGGGGAGYGGAA